MRLSIRFKLLLTIGLPFLALAGAALAIDHVRQRERALHAARVDLAHVASRGATQLDGFFRTAANLVRAGADVTAARGMPADEEIYASLVAILEHNPEIYGACFAVAPDALTGRTRFAPYVCRDGKALRSMDLSTAYDYTQPQWEWFAKPFADGQEWWTEPYFDEGAGNAAMVTFSVPVRINGRTAAIATVDILLEDLQRRLTLPTEPVGAAWIILSRNGTFVSVLDRDLLLNATIFDVARRQGRRGLQEMGARMIAGRSGSADFDGIGDGEPNVAAFEPIPATGWSFAMHAPRAAVLGPVYAQLQSRLLGAGIVSLALLAIVIAAAFWVTRPIPRLAAAVRELGAGKLDTRVTGVTGRDELGDLATGFNTMVEELNRHVESLTAATAARERVEGELRIAREIQMSLLPSTFPAFPERPEFDLHAVNAAARSIAGDFFDFELLPGDRLYFVIADVSGKGVPAALFMAVSRTLLRNMIRTTTSPAQILDAVNRVLIPENKRNMFVTLFMGIYDIRTGVVRYVNAGHPPARLVDVDGAVRQFGADDGGMLVGVIEGAEWQDAQATLGPGQTLVLYTDGVSEAGMGEKALFGTEGLDAVLATCGRQSPRVICDTIAAEVDRYQSGHIADDVTVLVLRRVT